MKRVTIALTGSAILALVAQPALASATRSGSALPLMALESAASSGGNGASGRCFQVNDNYVQMDANGSPILDRAGRMIACRQSSGVAPSGGGGPPLYLALGLLTVGGIVAGASGGGGNGGGGADSPG